MNKIERCPRCGIILTGDELFCPECGISLNQEVKKEKSYWGNPIIWAVFITLVVMTTLMGNYLSNHPIELNDTKQESDTTLTIKETTNQYALATNQNFLGISYVSDDSVYLNIGGELLKFDQQFNEQEKILDIAVTGFLEDDDSYYYVNYNDNNYVKKDKKSGKEDILLKNVYYVHKLGNLVYYQNDDDNESIHCLDLKNNEDKKINDEISYNLIIDEKKQMIFYTNPNSELLSIKTDGSDKKKIADKVKNYTYDGKTLFYITDKGLISDDLTGKQKIIYENIRLELVNLVDETLVVQDTNTIYTMSKSGEKHKKLYTMDIGGKINFEVVGDKLLVLTKGVNDSDISYEIVALDGKRHLLEEQSKPVIEGNDF